MNRNDHHFKTVIDKNKELRHKISKLSLRILKYKLDDVEKDAKDNGYWNEKYLRGVLKEFFMDMSFSLEALEIFIEDEIIPLGKLKNTKDYFVDTNNQLPN